MRVRSQERAIKQPILPKTPKEEPKIINLAVHLEKLTAQLNDGRELSIPIDWFAKWGVKGVSADKLKKHEIWEVSLALKRPKWQKEKKTKLLTVRTLKK